MGKRLTPPVGMAPPLCMLLVFISESLDDFSSLELFARCHVDECRATYKCFLSSLLVLHLVTLSDIYKKNS
jgi:hypothetical protein